MIPLLALWLVGCDYIPFTVDPLTDGQLAPNLRLKSREKRGLLPGFLSGPPAPAEGIVKSQCDDLADGGPVAGPGCVTGVLQCGETVIGHTVGGVNRFDSRFYEKNFCTPRITNHDGGEERVYMLEMPDGDWTANIWLDSPCADLDMAAFKWDGDDCPTDQHMLDQCEMWPASGTGRETVRLVTQRPTTWFVVVEGKNEHEGAFSLTVTCRPGVI